MRKILTRLIGAVVFFLVLPTLAVLALFPSSYSVKESILIEADPDAIHEMVRDLKNWEKWNTWTSKVPGIEISYSERTRSTGDSLAYLLPAGGPYSADMSAEQIAESEKAPREAFWKRQQELVQKISELIELVSKTEAEIEALSKSTRAESVAVIRPLFESLQSEVDAIANDTAAAEVLNSLNNDAIQSPETDSIPDRARSIRRQADFMRAALELVKDPARIEQVLGKMIETAEKNESHIPKLNELTQKAKEAEAELQATRDEKREHYASRTAVSVLLGSVRIPKVDGEPMDHRLTKVVEALEAESEGQITRSRFEELVLSTGVGRDELSEIEDELFEFGMMRVIRTQDRLTISPSRRIRPVSKEAVSTLLSMAAVWKREGASRERVLSLLSEYRLRALGVTKSEFSAAIDRLIALGAISEESGIITFTGADKAVELDATSLMILAELIVQGGWRWQMYAMKAQWLSKQDEAKVAPLLDELEAANVIERRITGDEEMIELTRDDGVGFRAVYGAAGRTESTHRLYYRITGEGRKTTVTWHVSGTLGANPVHRIAGMGVPSSLRPEMQESLRRLKVAAEEYQKQLDAEEEEGW